MQLASCTEVCAQAVKASHYANDSIELQLAAVKAQVIRHQLLLWSCARAPQLTDAVIFIRVAPEAGDT